LSVHVNSIEEVADILYGMLALIQWNITHCVHLTSRSVSIK